MHILNTKIMHHNEEPEQEERKNAFCAAQNFLFHLTWSAEHLHDIADWKKKQIYFGKEGQLFSYNAALRCIRKCLSM